jgi:hypothetical protein
MFATIDNQPVETAWNAYEEYPEEVIHHCLSLIPSKDTIHVSGFIAL